MRTACAVDHPRPKTSKPARSPWTAGIRTSTATPDVCVINSLSVALRVPTGRGIGVRTETNKREMPLLRLTSRLLAQIDRKKETGLQRIEYLLRKPTYLPGTCLLSACPSTKKHCAFNVVATHYEQTSAAGSSITPSRQLFPNTTCLAACARIAVSEPYLFRQHECLWPSTVQVHLEQLSSSSAHASSPCTLAVSPSFESPPSLYLRSERLGARYTFPSPTL